ncbi:MAG: hypothetical protein WBH47_24390 [Streptosporangiaceae bacterium]
MSGSYSNHGPQLKNRVGGELRRHRFIEDTPVVSVDRAKIRGYDTRNDPGPGKRSE